MLLVIGSNGLLGRSTARYFRSISEQTLCATHNPNQDSDFYFDLEKSVDNLKEVLSENISHALICSSITNIDTCFREREKSRHFNVYQTIELIRMLFKYHIKPVFCSTDLVFEGDRGNYQEEDQREPTTKYGRQKKEVEDFLLSQSNPFIIIRMSKLFCIQKEDISPIGQTIRLLGSGNIVQAADDQVVCPTLVDDISRIIFIMIQAGVKGVYHVSNPNRFTRYSLAMEISKLFGRTDLIKRCSIKDFPFLEPRPVNNSLNTDKFRAEYDFEFTPLVTNVKNMIKLFET